MIKNHQNIGFKFILVVSMCKELKYKIISKINWDNRYSTAHKVDK